MAKQVRNCVFCDVAHNDPRKQIEWRGDSSVVITPLNPVVPGHRLVIPKVHVQDAFESPDVLGQVMRDASVYAREMRTADCNVITSVGPAATQTVFHLHVHLVPRFARDGLYLPWTNQQKK